jgi:arylsulfatase A-like enzyme
MNKKIIAYTVPALLLGVSSGCLIAANSSKNSNKTKQPNVILIMTDDQGYANLSCMGHPILKTPNADNLYKNSIRLTDYHVDPTCAPSRSALMSGRYSHRVGVWHTIMGKELMKEKEVIMPELFKESGYSTAFFGKWHLGDNYPFSPRFRGFQKTLKLGGGGIGQGPDFWGNDYFDDVYFENGKPKQFKGFCTDIFFKEAINFIDKNKNKPFFVYLAPNAPHCPMYSPDKFSKRFKNMKYKDLKLNKMVTNYYGMIENIDYNLGLMIDFLKKNNLYDNTILIFTTDNGPVTKIGLKIYNAGLHGKKGSYFDGGHRVFFFLSYPDKKLNTGTDVNETTAHIDILPTLIELCHLKNTNIKFDGRSLVPLLENPNANFEKRNLFVESQRVNIPIKYRKFSVMNKEWRLTGTENKNFQLYKILEDRGQKHNISTKYPDIFKSMLNSYDMFWNDVSKENSNISRIIIGNDNENPIRLMSHDWVGSKGAWSQGLIQKPKNKTPQHGIWEIKVEQDAWYQFSLRRWPAESDQTINAEYIGKGINAKKAAIDIEGQHFEKSISNKDKEITFRIKLTKGETSLDAYFISEQGKIGAFYVYILKETGNVDKNWQTRKGLGLPLAIWPKTPGKDTTATLLKKDN